MIRDVTEQFSFLLGDGRPTGAQLLTRPSGVSSALGAVLLGIDPEGQRHLLVPIRPELEPNERVSRGVVLGYRELEVATRTVRFADLSCTIARLVGPFDQLIADILGRLDQDPRAGLNAVTSALDDWRSLLRRAMDGLSREEVVGLIGELEVMLTLAVVDPVAAVFSWTGPTGATHDFSRSGRDIEVKATAAVNATSVRISNLDQLDPTLSTSLHLAVVHLAEATDAPDIDARIDKLLSLGVPGDALDTRLDNAGYSRGMELAIPTRYTRRALHWWNVDAGSPGLRASDIPQARLIGIDAVSYDLLLGVLPVPLSSARVEALLEDWAK